MQIYLHRFIWRKIIAADYKIGSSWVGFSLGIKSEEGNMLFSHSLTVIYFIPQNYYHKILTYAAIQIEPDQFIVEDNILFEDVVIHVLCNILLNRLRESNMLI